MSSDMYQNHVIHYQKEIAGLRKKIGSETEKKARLIKDISTLSSAISRTKTASTINSKMNQLSRKEKDMGKVEKKIGEYENKLSNKTKDLNRYQKCLNKSLDKDRTNNVNKEKQSQRELLNNLQQINRELQKKAILEKELGVNIEDTIESYYLLKGKIMENPELSVIFTEQFEFLVKKNALDCFYFNVSGGDSILILEKSIKKIIKIAKRIIEDTNELESNPQIRIAIDYGDITYKHSEGVITKIVTGLPLRISARLEPFVKPNEVWCTENCFINDEYTNKILGNEIDSLEITGESFNIKKSGSTEEDIFIKIFKV